MIILADHFNHFLQNFLNYIFLRLGFLCRHYCAYVLYRVTGNAQILENALFPKFKLTKDLN